MPEVGLRTGRRSFRFRHTSNTHHRGSCLRGAARDFFIRRNNGTTRSNYAAPTVRKRLMHRGNIQFAALLAWISLAGDLAFAKDEPTLPAPGSKTSDGFTFSALWHAHYTQQSSSHGMYLAPDLGLNNPCLNRGDRCAESSSLTGDADVTEEVN